MNILIFGAGNAGKFLYDEIETKAKNIHVCGFIDNKIQGSYKGTVIESPEKLLPNKEVYDAVFIAAGAQKTVKIAIDTIRSYGMREIYMLHDIAGKNRLSPFDEMGNIAASRLRKVRFSLEKPTLPYFEVPITDQCNLNCKGCLFACNAVGGNEHIAYNQIEKDALRMRELFYDVPWIRILGGEPLMHPRIMDILGLYRRVFKDSEIDLCTNGLLLPKLSEEFFRCLIQNSITIHVSGYKPTYNLLDKIDAILKKYNLNYTLLKRESFFKCYTLQRSGDEEGNFEKCMTSGCRELYNGRLLRCSGVIAFEKFNSQFGTAYETKENEDWFDIHRKNIDPWELKSRLDKASYVCGYCDVDNAEEFGWDYAGKDAKLSDYILK